MISGIFLKILSIVLLVAVGLVLILGIGTLFKGGETSKKENVHLCLKEVDGEEGIFLNNL